TPAPAPKQIVLKASLYYQANDERTKPLNHYAQLINERTEGRVNIKVYPGQQLMKVREEFAALMGRTIDINQTTASYYVSQIPLAEFEVYPMFGIPSDKLKAALDAVAPILEEEWNAKGVKSLYAAPGIIFYVYAVDDYIDSIKDYEGRLFRGPTGIYEKTVGVWGAKLVPTSSPEQYVALQRGVMDSGQTSSGSILAYRLYEVAPYMTNSGWQAASNRAFMNLRVFNELPEDIQKIFVDTAKDTSNWAFETWFPAWVSKEAEDLEAASGKPVRYFPAEEMVKMRDVLPPIWEEYVAKYGDRSQRIEELWSAATK
ncbi:TRAP transporter substrate-binding protein, partial [Chloroflexota bacterium]